MNIPLPVLGSYFTLREFQISVPVGTIQQVVGANPNRYALLLCAVSGKQINLFRNPNLPAGGSLTLGNAANASIQFVALTFAELGALVQDAWFCQSGSGGVETLGVNEVLYMPPGGSA